VIATSSARVYVGGFFDVVGGQPRQRVVASDLDGVVTPFVANVPATTIGRPRPTLGRAGSPGERRPVEQPPPDPEPPRGPAVATPIGVGGLLRVKSDTEREKPWRMNRPVGTS
jgi:hypothetical protein